MVVAVSSSFGLRQAKISSTALIFAAVGLAIGVLLGGVTVFVLRQIHSQRRYRMELRASEREFFERVHHNLMTMGREG